MRVAIDGVGIEFTDVGVGAPVLLLHGWPDSGRLWRHQVPALVDAGLRVIVPDLRGAGHSDAPDAVEAYSMRFLIADVLGLMDHLGLERAHVVGHDWGAALAWIIAAAFPNRVDRLVALSVGHPRSFAAAGQAQREKSWYMLLFQFRDVAERWLSEDGWAHFREWAAHPDHDQVVALQSRPGRLTAGLAWYRANVPPEALLRPPSQLASVRAPTMGVWSSGDIALLEPQMTGSASYVDGTWRYERIDDAGHWMQLDAPDQLNRLLVDFLR